MSKRQVQKKFKKKLKEIYTVFLMHEIEMRDSKCKMNCGRRRTVPIKYYIDWIVFVLISGIPWENLEDVPELSENVLCKPMSIKQQFYRWNNVGIFDDLHDKAHSFYVENGGLITETYIDSTDVQNRNGLRKDTGYNSKFKNKRAIRLHSLCDNNKVSHSFVLTPANIKDDQMTEKVVNNIKVPLSQTYRNPLYIGADKGYIFAEVKRKLKMKNIILTYEYKKNQKKRNRGQKKEQILEKRITVEHSYMELKKGYKRTNVLYDRNINVYKTFLKMANTFQILKCPRFINAYIEKLKQ